VPRLQNVTPPRRLWTVDQWLPTLETTGFTGGGGQGKTLTAMQLATAKALGLHWFGIALPCCKVFALLCEDSVFRRRPHPPAQHQPAHDCDFADLENMLVYHAVLIRATG
jgi:hypothetical protein